MTAIVRVKRHRGEDPVEALLLSCKRKKVDSNSSNDLFERVFNFSGTVEDKDDKIATSTVLTFNKKSKYSNFKKNHTPDIKLKLRQERKKRSEENRFTLLSCLMSRDGTENLDVNTSEDSKENFVIVDVNKESNETNAVPETSEEDSYVYDLYSTQEGDSDFNDLYIENLLSIQPLETELEFRNGEDYYEELDPDEDDSNDENNWRNDYPDTGSSMDEDEDEDDVLARQLKNCYLGKDDCELSSDSGEDEYLNYKDEECYHYYEAKDLAGKRYAKYKANAMKEMIGESDEIDGGTSESDDDFRDCEL